MKFLNKILFIAAIWGISSCGMTDLDLQDNPNAVTAENAGIDFLYNSVQIEFANVFNATWFPCGTATRQYTLLADNYITGYGLTAFNGIWRSAYAEFLPDADALIALAEPKGLDIHVGSAKVLKAYVIMTLVDMFGDVPYSEALKGTDPISPKADRGQAIYDAANILLDEAITAMTGTTSASPKSDVIYKGSAAKWITLAKTLKLRAALQTRLVNAGGAKSTIQGIIDGGDLIDATAEDFQFQYGTQRVNPNSRHPFYNNSYETADGDYMNTYYMWLLHNEKGFIDPRIRFYFYRQDLDLSDQNVTEWGCVFSVLPDQNARPAHFTAVDPNMPYCITSIDGYTGRDHANGDGIPPDGPFRTMYGVYPGGGSFDDNSRTFTQASGTLGGLGAGINPILLASFVDFMRAEAALTLGTTDDAKTRLEAGIRKSMDKVISFKSLANLGRVIGTNPDGTSIFASALVPTQADIDAYVTFVLGQYDAADDTGKLNIVMKEYHIALWGNGLDSYNNYRRTAMPLRMQPGLLDPAVGNEFPRSFVYPSDYVNLNSNAQQKADNKVKVFWDTNPASSPTYMY